MANLYGSLSNLGIAATQLTNVSSNSTGGIYLKNDPASPNTIQYGFTNTVTAVVAATLTNTTQDNTNGYTVKVGEEVFIGRGEFIAAGATRVDPSLVFVISIANSQRAFWKQV